MFGDAIKNAMMVASEITGLLREIRDELRDQREQNDASIRGISTELSAVWAELIELRDRA